MDYKITDHFQIFESKGKDKSFKNYILDGSVGSKSISNERSSLINFYGVSFNKLKEIFLPVGYPYSVSEDYLQYQIWDSLQAYFSHLSSALSLHSTLQGLGVGKESASVLASTLYWLINDGAGMITSIYFAYWKGSQLDNNSKQWRLFADVANDITHFLKLLAPLLPIPFVATLCISSIFLSLVGITGKATRASLIQHQALCDNMGDVAAKDGSQESMVNLAGLITSLTLISWLTHSPLLKWSAFIVCVVLHLFCNYKAMRSLKMNLLNSPRLLNIFSHYCLGGEILTLEDANREEQLFTGPAFRSDYLTPFWSVQLGGSVENFINCDSKAGKCLERYIKEQINDAPYDKYYIVAHNKKKNIYVFFEKNADEHDHLLSFWAAYQYAIEYSEEGNPPNSCELSDPDLILKAKNYARKTFPNLIQKLKEKGWFTSHLRINVNEYTICNSIKNLKTT